MHALGLYRSTKALHLTKSKLEATNITITNDAPEWALCRAFPHKKAILTDGNNSLVGLIDSDGAVRYLVWVIPHSNDAAGIIRTLESMFQVKITAANGGHVEWVITKPEFQSLVDDLLRYFRCDGSFFELGWPKALWAPDVSQIVMHHPHLLKPEHKGQFVEALVAHFDQRLRDPSGAPLRIS